jgi:uncharacterized membrane protein YdjX (TVP38/TMEM64 family)
VRRILKRLKWSTDVLLVVALVWATRYAGQLDYVQNGHMQRVTESFGVGAPLAFISMCAVAIAAFVPPILPIGLGAVAFGKTVGAAYSLLGMTIGACLAFFLARRGAARLAERFKKGQFAKVDDWMARCNEFACMFSLRLIFFSNPVLNYVSSATRITLRDYTLATFVGLIPRTFMVSYFFERFVKVASVREMLTDPVLLSFPLVRVAGVVLLIALTRGAGRDVV